MQYLVPTPEGEQPDVELAYLVVDGKFIPASEVRNPATCIIVTLEQQESQQQHEEVEE